jgi:trichothecene 3-O-acetyltransferase
MYQLSVFDQIPSLGAYTVICLLWPIDDVAHDELVVALEKASLTLTKAFPFLAGQVVNEKEKGTEDRSSGTYRITNYEPHNGKPPIRVKDCTSLCPSYEELRKRRAPMSMLDGSILSPMQGLPYYYDRSEPLPVFILQANFIKGGLLLTSACMHNALDMNGQGQVIRLLAQALRGEKFSEAHIRDGNVDRCEAIPLLKPDENLLAHERLRCPSSLSNPAFGGSPNSAPWKLFNLQSQKLVKLKEAAAKECCLGKDVAWVSTNDALTAFVWQRVTFARSARLGEDTESTLIRASDARRSFDPPLPEGYMGHCVACGFTTGAVQAVVEEPLSTTARKLRKSLNEIDDYHVRSMATTLKTLEDKTTFTYGATFDPGTDLMVSSWAELGLYQCPFGPLLGKPEFVRRPVLTQLEGLVYFMPRTDDGAIAVAMSIREDDAKALMEDPVWRSYAEVID